MASISRTLQRIKQDIAPYLPDPWIVQACQEVQHRWRRRQFDPVQTLHLFLLQILCFNTALNHLRHLSKLQMTAAGFCKARKRLPLAVLQRLLRELRYVLAAKGQRTRVVTIVTTLTDPWKYPKQEIAALYGLRWTVETHLGELKTHLKMRKLKCKSVAGVQKELAVYCLVYNLVHAVMLKAAQRQQVPPDRISFLDTVRWLLSAEPGEKLPKLIVNPKRPDRHEPRVVKDLPDSYRKMSKSRNYLKHHPKWAKR